MVKAIQSGPGKSESDDQPDEIAATRQRVWIDDDGNTVTEPPQPAPFRRISPQEFQRKATGGPVRSWERALSEHQQRRASTPAPKAPSKPKPNW